MSMLHQVLKDIDQRTEPVSVAVPSLQLDAPSNAFRGWLPVISLLVTLMLIAGLFWSVTDDQNSAHSVPDYAALTVATDYTETLPTQSQPLVPAVVAPAAANPDQTIPASVNPATVTEAPPSISVAVNQVKEDSSPVSADPEPQPAVKNNTLQAIAASSSPATGIVVERRPDNAHTAYVSALSALKNQDYGQAISQIERALASDNNPNYQALKLRIFLEEKNREQFVAYFREHAENRNEHWLAVAAPGLHMLGHPDLAVAPYQQLIVLQPGVVNWPLALASAWEDQTKPAPAVAVLKNVIAHYRLTPSQKQWVVRKIEVLGGQSRS